MQSSKLKKSRSVPKLEEEILLAHTLGKSREFIYAYPDLALNKAELEEYEQKKTRLANGEPLAYILGFKWFYGNKIMVNPNVLIPRPETELLVDLALEYAKLYQPKFVIDIGTGSGAIIISIAKNIKNSKQQPAFYGLDISQKALEIAKRNAVKILKKSIKFLRSDLLFRLRLPPNAASEPILFVANLPYLSKKELKEPSIQKEPILALYGGKNPAGLIQALLCQIMELAGKEFCIILEINYDQAKKVCQFAKKTFKTAKVTVYKDLAGFDRIVKIQSCPAT